MCLEDFLNISPTEFMAIHDSWLEREKLLRQEAWNRARWTVFKTLCPPDKKKINIFDIEQFEWDPREQIPPETPVSTRERFDELTKKYGKRLQVSDRNNRKRQELRD